MASTPAGVRVVVENQYLKTDHDHLTRGLAYALGVRPPAKALVVISEEHRAEFVAIADYLNTAYERLGADDGIAVFLVTLAVERVDGSFMPRFEVVSRPNAWLAEVQGDAPAEPVSIEAFLASCPEPVRGRARQIVTEWTARAGATIRINPASRSLALDYPYSQTTNHRSVYVLYNNDLITVNRGYFIESGAVPEAAVPDMNAKLRTAFPLPPCCAPPAAARTRRPAPGPTPQPPLEPNGGNPTLDSAYRTRPRTPLLSAFAMPDLAGGSAMVLVSGLPGAGKTTLATALSEELSAVLLSKDAVKEALAIVLPASAVSQTSAWSRSRRMGGWPHDCPEPSSWSRGGSDHGIFGSSKLSFRR